MKKVTAIILSVLLTLTLFSACKKDVPTPETTTAATTSQTETAPETTTEKESETSKKEVKEKPFEKWDERDIVKYFKDKKIFTDDDNLSIITKDEELPDGVNAEVDYDNHNNDEIYVLIYYLDSESSNKKTEEIYNSIKKNKCAEIDGNEGYQQPFNALIGRFAVFYSSSIDERFVEKFENALDELIKEKNVKPVYYDKDLDLSKFNQDDDVQIIVGDD